LTIVGIPLNLLLSRRWIPNCGPRIIINENLPVKPKLLNPNFDPSDLPLLSQPCYQLSNHDFPNNINIFTEFGDLTPNQVLSLFDSFVSWPEFPQCSFNASLESALIKMHSSPDESVESRDLVEEVDDEEEKKS
jgi:dimethyladenosine transferase 2, mitochondrial